MLCPFDQRLGVYTACHYTVPKKEPRHKGLVQKTVPESGRFFDNPSMRRTPGRFHGTFAGHSKTAPFALRPPQTGATGMPEKKSNISIA
jgi:hypothetical protein